MRDQATEQEQHYSSRRIFIAPSVTQAMHAVRREMGDHAVIVQVRRNIEDESLVEVVASSEETDHNVAEMVVPDPSSAQLITIFAEKISEQFNASLQPRLLMAAEHILETQAAEVTDLQDLLLAVLEKEMPRLDIFSSDFTKLPLLFFGPAGMGKTSVAMKCALQYRLAAQPVRLFNLDSSRIGDRYTIANFAKLTEVTAHHIRDESVLRKIAETEQEFHLIDTPSMNMSGAEEFADHLKIFTRMPHYQLLVVSHSCDEKLLSSMFDNISKYTHIDGIVITGMDVYPDYTRMMNIVLESGLPLVGFSSSPEIASGLIQPEMETLIQQMSVIHNINQEQE